ncbi:MAG: type I-PGING CRISPR-associated protein Cas5p [Bacteroidia bacterium]|nr:type I-PGING CRISPR-associated protein Cas5p [Bacteroidia bacterium]
MKTDLTVLFQHPKKDKKAILYIEPLAPLSIVSTLPGSYYKSQDGPTKHNICGMFENVLGWHIGMDERRKIIKKMKAIYKKAYRINDIETDTSAVGYTSLLGHLFEVELPMRSVPVCRYDDLWKQQMKHDDSRHLKGTPNLSSNLIKEKRMLPTDENGKISDGTYSEFFKQNSKSFPMYYTSPTPREFIVIDGVFQYTLSINANLLNSLLSALETNNIAYLGTSEGWVDLSIQEI